MCLRHQVLGFRFIIQSCDQFSETYNSQNTQNNSNLGLLVIPNGDN